MIGVAMRDEHDVGAEIRGPGKWPVPLERPEPGTEEGVRQDSDPANRDERRRVADEPNGEGR
jgi:hypothetical protein